VDAHVEKFGAVVHWLAAVAAPACHKVGARGQKNAFGAGLERNFTGA